MNVRIELPVGTNPPLTKQATQLVHALAKARQQHDYPTADQHRETLLAQHGWRVLTDGDRYRLEPVVPRIKPWTMFP